MSGSLHPLEFDLELDRDARIGGRGFNSFMCKEPIPYSRRCCRDALIQATLDPQISSLTPVPPHVSVPEDAFFVFGGQFQNKLCAIALCESTSGFAFPVPPGFDDALALSRSIILDEPACSTARAVWSRRDALVSLSFQVDLLKLLHERPEGLGLAEAALLAPSDERGVDAILAMATRGIVQLHYRRVITDLTRITMGNVAISARAEEARQSTLWRGIPE